MSSTHHGSLIVKGAHPQTLQSRHFREKTQFKSPEASIYSVSCQQETNQTNNSLYRTTARNVSLGAILGCLPQDGLEVCVVCERLSKKTMLTNYSKRS